MQRTRNIAAALIATVIGVSATQAPWTARAAESTEATTFHPTTPCRILDTRPGPNQIGDRVGALGAGDVHVQDFGGAHGNCDLPTGDAMQAVALNVTVAEPTAQSNLRVYPAGAEVPVTANLNWLPGAPPTPNKVDVALTDGAAAFRNAFGEVDLIVDVVGYYSASPVDTIQARLERLESRTEGSEGSDTPSGPRARVQVFSHENVVNFFLKGEAPERAAWLTDVQAPEDGSLILTATATVRAADSGTGIRCWFLSSGVDMDEPLDATWTALSGAQRDTIHAQRVFPIAAGVPQDLSWTCERTGDGTFTRFDDIALVATYVPNG